MSDETVLLRMNNIHKRFPGVYALNDVSIELHEGEVLSLLGENGAGKSTLIKILGGIYSKDEGSIEVSGKEISINNVADARSAGISIIHQELVLVPYLNVAANIFLGRELRTKRNLLDSEAMLKKSQKILDSLKIRFSATKRINELTVAQQQMVEIAKAISFDAKIIVMDEPTSALSDADAEALFDTIDRLKASGIGIIYISHRMSELQRVADRVTVMRDGKVIATKDAKTTSNDELVALMVGRDIGNYYNRNHALAKEEVVLEVEGLSSDKVHDVSFKLHKGEILGFGGLVGCGRTESILAMLGIDKRTSGKVLINGKEQPRKVDAHEAFAQGLGFVPEDRRDEGMFPLLDVRFNMSLKSLPKVMRGAHYDKKLETELCKQYMEELSIKAPGIYTTMNSLSGGNQQKVILSSWLLTEPMILILDEPTRGIDVGAKSEIYQIINDLTANGVSIIIISSELPELINMSDRVVVMCDGTVTACLEQGEISQENIMKYAVSY